MTSEDFYRFLLKVYPARYRRKYEQAMTQCFRDQLRAADTGGKRVRLWFRTIADFALNAPARHFDPGPITLYRNAYSERARRAIYLARLEKGPFSYGEITVTATDSFEAKHSSIREMLKVCHGIFAQN
jgi:hypothetical protein